MQSLTTIINNKLGRLRDCQNSSVGTKITALDYFVRVLFTNVYPDYFENGTPLKLVLGSIHSLANYTAVYEETQYNRVSGFRFFFFFFFFLYVFLLSKDILDFYLTLLQLVLGAL